MTTSALDLLAERLIRRVGATPAVVTDPQGRPFPGHIAVCVNDTVANGVPSDTELRPGDLVTIDVALELGGFAADLARPVVLKGPSDRLARELADASRRAALAAATACREGARSIDLIEAARLAAAPFTIVRGPFGHGINTQIHDAPALAWPQGTPTVLQAGMILAIEPIVTAGTREADGFAGWTESPDGWSIRTRDGLPGCYTEVMVEAGPDRGRVLGSLRGDARP